MGTTNLDSLALSGDLSVGDDLSVVGDVTLSVPLKVASANESLKREQIHLSFDGTLADGSTNRRQAVLSRAGSIKSINIAARTKMVGGTNTLALARIRAGASTNLLSTTNVDPTAVPAAADTGEALTLAAAANLAFQAGDILRATLVCGTMTTDGADYSLVVEVEYTDA